MTSKGRLDSYQSKEYLKYIKAQFIAYKHSEGILDLLAKQYKQAYSDNQEMVEKAKLFIKDNLQARSAQLISEYTNLDNYSELSNVSELIEYIQSDLATNPDQLLQSLLGLMYNMTHQPPSTSSLPSKMHIMKATVDEPCQALAGEPYYLSDDPELAHLILYTNSS